MRLAYSIIIPAFNEEQTIDRAMVETARQFRSLKKPFEIIVVDDGSTDRTGSVVRRQQQSIPEAILVRHRTNLGKGAAVSTGVARAAGDVFLFLDADLATHPSEFKKFIPLLPTADIVIGSRVVKHAVITERQPFYRILAGKLFNVIVVRWYLGLPFRDTQCGFKAFHQNGKRLFRDLASKGWSFDAEVLVRAQRAGLRIAEVPVTWRHERVSRVRLHDAFQILKELIRMKRY